MRKRLQRIEGLEVRYLLAADFQAADFNEDYQVDATDIDLLAVEIRSTGNQESDFDLTEDGIVDDNDLDYLIETLLETRRGDANLDGFVDFSDFLILTDNFGEVGGWADGNFGSDDQIGFQDFLDLATNIGRRSLSAVYSYQSAGGNRYTSGWSNLPESTPIDIQLDFVPVWVLAAKRNAVDYWFASSADGQTVAGFMGSNGSVQQFAIPTLRPGEAPTLAPGVPPALLYDPADAVPISLVTPLEIASNVPSHPTLVGTSPSDVPTQVAFINRDGDLVVNSRQDSISPVIVALEVNALPDSRVLADGEGRFLLLTDPTDSYPHGIFGDRIEASSFTIVDSTQTPPSITTVPVPEGHVIESLIPTWIDVDDDGEREVIVTISDLTNGGQVTIYNEQGEVEIEGPGIGRTFRWRHQLAVAPFGPNGETEFVDVLTPHIGGVVEFRSLEDGLPIVGSLRGYTSHVNRSANIDMAAAADFDSDNIVELLLPNQRRDRLGAITRTDTGAELDWDLEIGGTLTTNVAVSRSITGQLSVLAGRNDGVLRIWSN